MMLTMRYVYVRSSNVVYTSISTIKLIDKRPSLINNCFNPLFFYLRYTVKRICDHDKMHVGNIHRLSNVLSQRRERQIRPRCRPTTGYDRALWTIICLGAATVTARTLPDVNPRGRLTEMYRLSTLIQTAWSPSAAACWPCSCRRPCSVYVNKSFSCCRHRFLRTLLQCY